MCNRSVILLLSAGFLLHAQTSDEKDATAAVQKVFNGMAAHDAAMMKSVMLTDARLYAVRDDAAPTSTAGDEFISRIATMKGDLLERFTGQPSISIHGRIAQVWGDYEFLRDGKFGHCGVDSFSLLKTPDGWKVASIVYTAETTGCKGH